MLFHIEHPGEVLNAAWVVRPTSQNQPGIEDELRNVAAKNLPLDEGALKQRCE